MTDRIRVDGKQFAQGPERFRFHGVTYGTFTPRDDGERYPARDRVKLDFAAMRAAGFTVVRTYTPPPDDVIDLAADWGLHLLVDLFYPDWRYLVGASRRQQHRIAREARSVARQVSQRLSGNEVVLGISVGNEIPADAVRWVGTSDVSGVIEELADTVRAEDPERLVTYANYPTAEYLPLDTLDFLTFNVFLERRADFRRYLTRLQHLAGDRPLVLGEVGFDAGDSTAGEEMQAQVVDWQLETALERGVAGTCLYSWTDEWWVGDAAVEGWQFGLTRADRSPRPALAVARKWNAKTVADLPFPWPTITVVICAYNAAATLDECLRHTCALEYPGLEVVVVDDGSTDGTADIARRYPRVRLVSIPHGGLSVARNEGYRAATSDLVAYLDSDAYPSPEWPYYLALALDGPRVAGAGGPNVPPPSDPPGAQCVARAPGGPVHVLLSDDRAEHVPGCNMAFWREALLDLGGFDPVYTDAGDDVDFCWRVLDRGWEIGFHPGALVWHHRRSSMRAYLRQQRGYGRSEALVEARHPNRFTASGTARWRGMIYNSFAPSLARQRIYRGEFATAPYQSVYRGGGYAMDHAHQIGIPAATALVATAPLGAVWVPVALMAVLAAMFLVVLAALDIARARPPHSIRNGKLRFRVAVAALHLLQPLARLLGRLPRRAAARRELCPPAPVVAWVRPTKGGGLLLGSDCPRAEVVAHMVAVLQRAGFRVVRGIGWEDYDARVVGSTFLVGEVISSSYPVGYVQLRVRRRLRRTSIAVLTLGALVVSMLQLHLALGLALIGTGELARGLWRTGPGLRRIVERAAP